MIRHYGAVCNLGPCVIQCQVSSVNNLWPKCEMPSPKKLKWHRLPTQRAV
jgi:hypothetical protein